MNHLDTVIESVRERNYSDEAKATTLHVKECVEKSEQICEVAMTILLTADHMLQIASAFINLGYMLALEERKHVQ